MASSISTKVSTGTQTPKDGPGSETPKEPCPKCETKSSVPPAPPPPPLPGHQPQPARQNNEIKQKEPVDKLDNKEPPSKDDEPGPGPKHEAGTPKKDLESNHQPILVPPTQSANQQPETPIYPTTPPNDAAQSGGTQPAGFIAAGVHQKAPQASSKYTTKSSQHTNAVIEAPPSNVRPGFRPRAQRFCGVIQVLLGCLGFGAGIAKAVIEAYLFEYFAGLWTSVFFIAAGILAVYTVKIPGTRMILTCLVVSLCAFVMAIVLIGFNTSALLVDNLPYTSGWLAYCQRLKPPNGVGCVRPTEAIQRGRVAMHSLHIALALLEMIAAVVQVILCSCTTSCQVIKYHYRDPKLAKNAPPSKEVTKPPRNEMKSELPEAQLY